MPTPFPVFQGQFILDGKFDPAFPLKHAQKDMRFAVVSCGPASACTSLNMRDWLG